MYPEIGKYMITARYRSIGPYLERYSATDQDLSTEFGWRGFTHFELIV